MTYFLQAILRFLLVAIWATTAFCFGSWASGWLCIWFVLPHWAKEYPHDGQLGLGVLACALVGGLLTAGFSLAFAFFWIARVLPARQAARAAKG